MGRTERAGAPWKDSGPGLWVPCREEFKQSGKLATRPSALRAETGGREGALRHRLLVRCPAFGGVGPPVWDPRG